MALRNIMNYQTDDILRKKARVVEIINSRILTLIEDMTETMYHANGDRSGGFSGWDIAKACRH